MAKLYRAAKSPTIYYQQNENTPLRGFTTPESYTGSGFQFGQEQEITPSEFENLKTRYGIGSVISSPLTANPPPAETPATPPITRESLEQQYGVTPLETEEKSWWEKLTGGIQSLIGTKKTSLEAAQTALAPDKQRIYDLDKQIADMEASYQLGVDKVRSQPIAMPIITGQLASLERQKNAKAGLLIADRNSLAGKYNDAMKNAIDAINADYDDKALQIKLYETQLNNVKDKLSEAQKLVASRIEAELKAENNRLNNERLMKTDTIKEYEYAVTQGGFTGAMTDWIKYNQNIKATGAASQARDTEVMTYLQQNKGTDGLVSAATYMEALRRFIAKGGNQTNFFASYPQQTYLRQQEIDKLPVNLKPKTNIGTEWVYTIPDGTVVDIGTVAGIRTLMQKYPQYGYADMFATLKEKTAGKMTDTTIKNLLISAGLSETKAQKEPTEAKRKVIAAINASRNEEQSYDSVIQKIENAGFKPEDFTQYLLNWPAKKKWYESSWLGKLPFVK